MTAQTFYDTYKGQSLSFDGLEVNRGQCVQSVSYYCRDNGWPVVWADAYQWWVKAPTEYQKIENVGDARPEPGDIIIWGPALGAGAGHIAVVLEVYPGTGTFTSIDSNWGGNKTVHKVKHDYNNVVGWLRIKSTPVQGGDVAEKATRDTAAILMHGVVARNGLRGRGYALSGDADADSHAGMELTNANIQGLYLSAEATQWRDSQDSNSVNGINARLDSIPVLEGQITIANNEAKAAKEQAEQLTKAVEIKDGEIKRLEDENTALKANGGTAPNFIEALKIVWRTIVNFGKD